MGNPSVQLLAWARINDRTKIDYTVHGEIAELTIGAPEGLTLDTTERGLENLLVAVSCALHALRTAANPVSAA
jgi:hypothetical protein